MNQVEKTQKDYRPDKSVLHDEKSGSVAKCYESANTSSANYNRDNKWDNVADSATKIYASYLSALAHYQWKSASRTKSIPG